MLQYAFRLLSHSSINGSMMADRAFAESQARLRQTTFWTPINTNVGRGIVAVPLLPDPRNTTERDLIRVALFNTTAWGVVRARLFLNQRLIVTRQSNNQVVLNAAIGVLSDECSQLRGCVLFYSTSSMTRGTILDFMSSQSRNEAGRAINFVPQQIIASPPGYLVLSNGNLTATSAGVSVPSNLMLSSRNPRFVQLALHNDRLVCGLMQNGSLFTWDISGTDAAVSYANWFAPTAVAPFRTVSASTGLLCVISNTGALACRRTIPTVRAFATAGAATDYTGLVTGPSYACGFKASGSYRCWGSMTSAQGIETFLDRMPSLAIARMYPDLRWLQYLSTVSSSPHSL